MSYSDRFIPSRGASNLEGFSVSNENAGGPSSSAAGVCTRARVWQPLAPPLGGSVVLMDGSFAMQAAAAAGVNNGKMAATRSCYVARCWARATAVMRGPQHSSRQEVRQQMRRCPCRSTTPLVTARRERNKQGHGSCRCVASCTAELSLRAVHLIACYSVPLFAVCSA